MQITTWLLQLWGLRGILKPWNTMNNICVYLVYFDKKWIEIYSKEIYVSACYLKL